MEDAIALRSLTEWIRGWAAVASQTDRPWHVEFSEYLEQRPELSRRPCWALEQMAAIH